MNSSCPQPIHTGFGAKKQVSFDPRTFSGEPHSHKPARCYHFKSHSQHCVKMSIDQNTPILASNILQPLFFALPVTPLLNRKKEDDVM